MPAPEGAAWAKPSVATDPVSEGQDDITGGSSRAGHRDGNDTINGDGDDDFVVGDNGSVARIVGTDAEERSTPSATGPSGPATPRCGSSRPASQVSPRRGSARLPRARRRRRPARCPVPSAPTPSSAMPARTCSTARTASTRSAAALTTTTSTASSGRPPLRRRRRGRDPRRPRWRAEPLRGRLALDRRPRSRCRPQVTYRSRLDGSVSREADLLHDVNGVSLVGTPTSSRDAARRHHLRRYRPDPRRGRQRLHPRRRRSRPGERRHRWRLRLRWPWQRRDVGRAGRPVCRDRRGSARPTQVPTASSSTT